MKLHTDEKKLKKVRDFVREHKLAVLSTADPLFGFINRPVGRF